MMPARADSTGQRNASAWASPSAGLLARLGSVREGSQADVSAGPLVLADGQGGAGSGGAQFASGAPASACRFSRVPIG